YYGSGCYDCGGWNSAGAAAVGLAAGTAIGAAGARAASANAYAAGGGYAMGAIYPTLPEGCVYRPMLGAYGCGGTFFKAAYGANGVYYRGVPRPSRSRFSLATDPIRTPHRVPANRRPAKARTGNTSPRDAGTASFCSGHRHENH